MHLPKPSIKVPAIGLLLGVSLLFSTESGFSAARISTFAGVGATGYSGDGGVATEAHLNNPYGISKGPGGALYI